MSEGHGSLMWSEAQVNAGRGGEGRGGWRGSRVFIVIRHTKCQLKSRNRNHLRDADTNRSDIVLDIDHVQGACLRARNPLQSQGSKCLRKNGS